MTPQYEIRHGSYYLIQKTRTSIINPVGEEILLMCDQLALAFDPEHLVMWKHGSVEIVEAWAQHHHTESFAVAVLTFPKGHPVDEINACLKNSNHFQALYEKISEGV